MVDAAAFGRSGGGCGRGVGGYPGWRSWSYLEAAQNVLASCIMIEGLVTPTDRGELTLKEGGWV